MLPGLRGEGAAVLVVSTVSGIFGTGLPSFVVPVPGPGSRPGPGAVASCLAISPAVIAVLDTTEEKTLTKDFVLLAPLVC